MNTGTLDSFFLEYSDERAGRDYVEDELIAAVFRRRALWDPSDKHRGNSRILQTMWNDVADEVGMRASLVKRKWKNLRSYFMTLERELREDPSQKKTSSWVFYRQMSFLKSVIAKPNNESNDFLKIEYSHGQPDEREDFDDYQDVENRLPGNYCVVSMDDGSLSKGSVSQSECITNDSIITTQNRENNNCSGQINDRTAKSDAGISEHSGGNVNEQMESLLQRVEILESKITEYDSPDMLFFRSLIPYMKDFTPSQKLRVRSELQNLILMEQHAVQ